MFVPLLQSDCSALVALSKIEEMIIFSSSGAGVGGPQPLESGSSVGETDGRLSIGARFLIDLGVQPLEEVQSSLERR
jgi:hypothetical protein